MDSPPIYHAWTPIADLSDADLTSANNRMPSLIEVWQELRHAFDQRQLEEFNERLNREWAIETGIIERLYTLDEGTTRLLIEQGIDASLIAHDDNGRSPELIAGIICDHQEAVEWLFEVVRQERDLTTSFVKELHHLMTRKQDVAEGVDSLGRRVSIPLRHGDYKVRPNNPTRSDGQVHEYCPPEHVTAEMDRLIQLHSEHEASEVPPDVSAAWLHHRFVQIHPFQDGNGRVARALASLVLIRAGWLPLVVNRKDRPRYISALSEADRGDLKPLMNLFGAIQERSITTALRIIDEVARETARLEQMHDSIVEQFDRRDQTQLAEKDKAKEVAAHLRNIGHAKFAATRDVLQPRINNGARKRQIFVDSGGDLTDQPELRSWYWYQVVDTAKKLDYYASLGDFHTWARLAFNTESGRSEILLSFHTVGRDFRGVCGATVCFYRKQQGEGIEQQLIDLQIVSEELFLVNYKETQAETEMRFAPWLERALVTGLDAWRRSE